MQKYHRKIMLVDDSKTFQYLFKKVLADTEYSLIVANGGEDALELIGQEYIDFICSSFHLKDMTGQELCQQIRKRTHFVYKPFVLLTAVESQDLLKDALPVGVTEIFHKRDVDQLLAYIRRFPFWNVRLEGHVLYVEDSRAQRELLKAMLERHGLTVDAFSTADEAWGHFVQRRYDVVVTDVILEGSMSGLGLVNKIRRVPGIKGDVPILAVTGFDDLTRRVELFNLGVTDYLIKPVIDEDLFVRLSGLISQSKLLEKLKESENLHRILFENAAIGIAKLSLTGQFLQINDHWCQLLGYTQQEMLRATFQDITHPDDLKDDLASVDQLISGKIDSYEMEKRYYRKDGSIIWVYLAVALQRNVSGDPLYFISAVHDITERRHLVNQIQDSADQYKDMLKTTQDGFWVVGAGGRLLDVNQAYSDVIGYSRDELLSMRVSDLEAIESPEQVIEHTKRIIAMGNDLFETKHRCKDGRLVDLEASVTFQRRNETFVCFFRHISERKKNEAAFNKAKAATEKALKRALAAERQIVNVSEETSRRIGLELHDDLGQHLASISYMAETMRDELANQSSEILPIAERVSGMIQEAISKTRNIAHGLYPIEMQAAGLHDMLDRYAIYIETTFGRACKRQIVKCCDIHDEFVVINLFRIVQEAVNNALKHSGASKLMIKLECMENAWLIEVADNGTGLPKASPMHDGHGLGMHTMSYRAMLIGASLDILSDETGGTIVRVLTPHVAEKQND